MSSKLYLAFPKSMFYMPLVSCAAMWRNSNCPLSIPVPTLLRVSFLSTKYWPAEGAFVGGSGAAVVASREKKDIFSFSVVLGGAEFDFQPVHSQEWSSSNFPNSLARNITRHYIKNLAFRSLLRWKIMILPILTPSLILFVFKSLEKSYSLNFELTSPGLG